MLIHGLRSRSFNCPHPSSIYQSCSWKHLLTRHRSPFEAENSRRWPPCCWRSASGCPTKISPCEASWCALSGWARDWSAQRTVGDLYMLSFLVMILNTFIMSPLCLRCSSVVSPSCCSLLSSARNGYRGTRVSESLPATRVIAGYPGIRVCHITRKIKNSNASSARVQLPIVDRFRNNGLWWREEPYYMYL